jgi:hypothetical protein
VQWECFATIDECTIQRNLRYTQQQQQQQWLHGQNIVQQQNRQQQPQQYRLALLFRNTWAKRHSTSRSAHALTFELL